MTRVAPLISFNMQELPRSVTHRAHSHCLKSCGVDETQLREVSPTYRVSSSQFLKQRFISSPGWQRQWSVSATQMLASSRPQRSTKQECRSALDTTSVDHSLAKMIDLFGLRIPASVKSASSEDFNDLPSGSTKERNDYPTDCRHRKNS